MSRDNVSGDKEKPLAPVPDEERERRVQELDRALSDEEEREKARLPIEPEGPDDPDEERPPPG